MPVLVLSSSYYHDYLGSLNSQTAMKFMTTTYCFQGKNIFGHWGFGGQVGMADPRHSLGWAYVTNYYSIFAFGDDPLYLQLIAAVYETIFELEKHEKQVHVDSKLKC